MTVNGKRRICCQKQMVVYCPDFLVCDCRFKSLINSACSSKMSSNWLTYIIQHRDSRSFKYATWESFCYSTEPWVAEERASRRYDDPAPVISRCESFAHWWRHLSRSHLSALISKMKRIWLRICWGHIEVSLKCTSLMTQFNLTEIKPQKA